jgi:hypothetical protein
MIVARPRKLPFGLSQALADRRESLAKLIRVQGFGGLGFTHGNLILQQTEDRKRSMTFNHPTHRAQRRIDNRGNFT